MRTLPGAHHAPKKRCTTQIDGTGHAQPRRGDRAADEVGLDCFVIGGHHTPEMPASAAATILAAGAPEEDIEVTEVKPLVDAALA